MSDPLPALYDARIAHGELRPDPVQRRAINWLERVRVQVEAREPAKKGRLLRIFGREAPPEEVKGLYLWGGVGRGKSMLMDMFYDHIDVPRKRRVHFHAFMQEVQAGLHAARKTGVDDAILPVADQVIAEAEVLCFDEMQITDIADAMIVGRLFQRLFDAGTVVITTSNRVPDDLYKDGLNRNLFLPFIAQIKEHMEVQELASDTDYRQNRLQGSPTYFSPIDTEARAAITAIWHDMSGGTADPLTLTVNGREVLLPEFRNGAARASFFDLCGHALGPADYLAIAEAVKILVMTDIPELSRDNFNQARRFVTLIDALYEARTRLIASAARPPEYLYIEGEGAFEFERTASRLREMQSADWGQ